MTRAHKAALATGREEGRAIRAYLEALDTHRPRRGRKRTADTVERQLNETLDRLATASALDRVTLLQRKMDLQQELERLQGADSVDLEGLEQAFIAAVKGYSERKGITYAAWREAGIDARVLREAGLKRGAGAA
jgi:hypothetical protein